jgi:hypothetical protein
LRLWTVLTLTLIDVAIYLDYTLRWESGFGFVRSAWLLPSLSFLALCSLSNLALCRRAAHALFHAVLAVVILTVAFHWSKSGIPFAEWSAPPRAQGPAFFGRDPASRFFLEGGGVVVLLGALAHGLLGQGLRSSLARRTTGSTLWLLSLGLSLSVLFFVGRFNAFEFTVWDPQADVIDPRGPTPEARETAAQVRAVFWSSGAVVGGALTLLAGARLARRSRRNR